MDSIDVSFITNNKTKTLARPSLEQTIEIDDHLLNDIRTTLNEVLKMNISQQELEKFMESILSIMVYQTEQYLNQYKQVNQSMQNQYYPDMFSYNSYFLSLYPSNFVQYSYSQNLNFQPFIYSNRFRYNPYPLQAPIIQQQYQNIQQNPLFQKKLIKQTKNPSKSHQKYKSVKKTAKKDDTGAKTVKSFNNLSLKSQQALISRMMKRTKKIELNHLLRHINNLLLFLIQFKPSKDDHFFSIKVKSINKKENKIELEEGILDLHLVQISHFATEKIIERMPIKSSEFSEHLQNFKEVSIEVKYPSSTFRTIYNQLLSMKRLDNQRIKVRIFISGISETDMEFRNDKNVNSIILDKSVSVIKGGQMGSFRGCSSLTEIKIPNSVTSIGAGSFRECISLESIIFFFWYIYLNFWHPIYMYNFQCNYSFFKIIHIYNFF